MPLGPPEPLLPSGCQTFPFGQSDRIAPPVPPHPPPQGPAPIWAKQSAPRRGPRAPRPTSVPPQRGLRHWSIARRLRFASQRTRFHREKSPLPCALQSRSRPRYRSAAPAPPSLPRRRGPFPARHQFPPRAPCAPPQARLWPHHRGSERSKCPLSRPHPAHRPSSKAARRCGPCRCQSRYSPAQRHKRHQHSPQPQPPPHRRCLAPRPPKIAPCCARSANGLGHNWPHRPKHPHSPETRGKAAHPKPKHDTAPNPPSAPHRRGLRGYAPDQTKTDAWRENIAGAKSHPAARSTRAPEPIPKTERPRTDWAHSCPYPAPHSHIR